MDIYCQNCGNQINSKAVICVKCGIEVNQLSTNSNKGHISIPIISLCTGLMGLFTFFDDSGWDYDTIIGCLVLWAILPIILGIISISNNHKGKGMGITGLVMGIISGIIYLVLLIDYI